MNKVCGKERQRPEYKGKPKRENREEFKPEVIWEDGIPYIMLGSTPYALDDDMKTIDYALTKVLREKLDKRP